MMKPVSDLTVTDLFAGAGGPSTGAALVPGERIRVASNHWQLAVDVHGENHQHADHICADISQISPGYFPRTEILWAPVGTLTTRDRYALVMRNHTPRGDIG